MTLITRTLPALYNGVSQQPPILRSSDQTEDELNTWASLATGVAKRPPTKSIAKIANTITNDAFIHHINRDVTERYLVIIESGTIKVFDTAGVQKTVNAPGGYGYLSGSSFAAVTVADYTFIVNRTKTCALGATGVDYDPQADYLRWLSNKPTTADLSGFGGVLGFMGVAIQYKANVPTGAYKGELPSMEKLPETAVNGDLYKITGSTSSGFASYYVRRSGAVWTETMAQGLQNALDETTMPHCLIREIDGTFTFAPFSWAPRRVGDVSTNPPPTFIGRKINDVFFYQNRLAFLVDENVIFSCAGDFGNFWRNTVLDYVDSDVVDVAVTTNAVSILTDAVTFSDGLLLFSDQTQFSLTNGEAGLTPSSVAIRPTTNFVVNAKAKPVALGTEVYFAGNQQGASVVWEYTRLVDSDATTAAEVTAHVPSLLPANLTDLIPVGKALLALTGGQSVYAYQFYWNGNEKVQSAWRPWVFGGDVVSGTSVGESVYLVVRRGDGVYLETMSFEPTNKPTEQPYQTYLDRLGSTTGSYNSSTDQTTFTLPYAPLQASFRLIRGNGSSAPHSLVDPEAYTWVNSTTVRVPGNEAAVPYTFGEAYTYRFEFSQQFAQTPQLEPITTGRLQLRKMTVNFTGTAFFRTEVQPYGNALAPNIEEIVPAKIADFTGKIVGVDDLRLNTPIYHTGSYSFQIYGNSALAKIALSNDTHVGSTFVSAEWEGFWSTRTGR